VIFHKRSITASNCFLDKEELQLFCSLVNSATKSINEDFLDAEITIVKILSSKLPDVLLNENTRTNLALALKWLSKGEAAFSTIYLLLSAGFNCRSFDSHMRSKFFQGSEDIHILSQQVRDTRLNISWFC